MTIEYSLDHSLNVEKSNTIDLNSDSESLHFMASSSNITTLPFEVLQRIASHLDGFRFA